MINGTQRTRQKISLIPFFFQAAKLKDSFFLSRIGKGDFERKVWLEGF